MRIELNDPTISTLLSCKTVLSIFAVLATAQLLPAQFGPYVSANNITHPDLSPNFIAGDTYQYVVYGNPNQPVYISQNSNPLELVGQTDSNGYYSESGVEQAAWIGSYTQVWYVGSDPSPTISFTLSAAAVVAQNLTHPGLAPSFIAGDSYLYHCYGPPNQPVYNIQNGGPLTQVGQTDGNGFFATSGVEQTAWVGNYTQLWFVGNNQAPQAFTFFVGKIGAGGTLVSSDVGQTSDGSVTGTSIVSVSNGTVSTYSSTDLDSTASLYYDVQTVGTLYQEGTAVAQGYTPILGGSAPGGLSAPAINWDDYDLQTDHYVVAFFIADDGTYENPLYFGEGGCGDANSDCTIGSGDGPYSIEAASIYLGSTLADQMSMPTDGSVPPFDPTLYDNFASSIAPVYPSGAWFTISVRKWATSLVALGLIIGAERSTGSDFDLHPIPFLVELIGPKTVGFGASTVEDRYAPYDGALSFGARVRTYLLRDSSGHAWNGSATVAVRERFSDRIGSGPLPPASGCWYASLSSVCLDGAELYKGTMDDHYSLTPLFPVEVGYIQYYYATNFAAPLALSTSGFSLPGVPYNGLAVPLFIKDTYNSCKAATGNIPILPGQPVRLKPNYSGIDGDTGPPPASGCANRL